MLGVIPFWLDYLRLLPGLEIIAKKSLSDRRTNVSLEVQVRIFLTKLLPSAESELLSLNNNLRI